MSTRQQLTLFVRPNDAIEIEQIREAYNPEQRVLIDSHVTLCREDELTDLEKVLSNLSDAALSPVTITFDPPVRFDNGKGVLIPGVTGNEQFHHLREEVLASTGVAPRKHQPHITLMHPRNATCTDEIFDTIKSLVLPKKLTFDNVSLIQQERGGVWRILQQFTLGI